MSTALKYNRKIHPYLKNRISSFLVSLSVTIFDVVTLTSTPSTRNLRVFFRVFFCRLMSWRGGPSFRVPVIYQQCALWHSLLTWMETEPVSLFLVRKLEMERFRSTLLLSAAELLPDSESFSPLACLGPALSAGASV